ncbi:MAG: zinc-dependent metalloprotease [Saprospiraceae bacterium]|nr:zinc-dependent metalloprotease [Saprospiraceae bacterium]
MAIQIPGDSKLYEFRAKHVESYTSSDFVWMGEIIARDTCGEIITDDECYSGYLRVLKESDRVYGEVQIDTNYYDIKYLGEGLSALVKLDGESFLPASGTDCLLPEAAPSFRLHQEVAAVDRNAICPVRVAVLFTQAALDNHPDILDIINLSVSSANQAFRNSFISSSELTISLAGTQLLTTAQFSEGDDLLQDVHSLVSNTTVAAARASMHADLVIVMTSGGYAEGRGVVAAFGDFPTASDSAFAIVEAAFANHPNYTFHHELAHLFGARHQDSDNCWTNHDDSGLDYAHGYAFEKGCACLVWDNKKWYHTIVSACFDNGRRQRIPHYSNPNVKYKNKKTGTETTNYNAKVLRDAACRVGNYVVSDIPQVFIQGYDRICPGEIGIFDAIIQEVPGPYSYEWYVSYDGFTWGNPISTASWAQVLIPSQSGSMVFIKLVAGNVNGPMIEVYKAVEVLSTTGEQCARNSNIPSSSTIAYSLGIYPNPLGAGELALRWQGDNSGHNTVSIFDSFGRMVGTLNRQVSEGENTMTFNLAYLPDGVYWLRLRSKTFDNTLRFVIVR